MSDKTISINSAPVVPPQSRNAADELVDLQRRRELLQIQQLEQQLALNAEALAKQEAIKAEGQALRRSTIATLEQGRAARRFAQEHCSHLKENGKTAVGGQRDSHRINHWICQACLKEWTGNDPQTGGLPFTLRPDPEKVGGPDF